jgi:predicted O-methyltransferase YrrM
MNNIVNERVVSFINSFDTGDSPVCMSIEEEARRDMVPIIRKEMASFLKVILAMKKPLNILEIGTAVGYSAVLMGENTSENTKITTIENYEVRIPIARNNFARAGMDDKITLIEGDALEVLKTLTGPYDFIFMDAAKAQYITILPDVIRLLDKDGILITDNVLQEGDIIESRYAVTRRNRTIYERMREYLYAVTHSDELVTSIAPIGDGITISIRK